MNQTPKKHVRGKAKANVIVVLALVVVVVAGFIIGRFFGQGENAQWAVIHDGDGHTTALDLSQDETTTITTSLGTNVITVSHDAVEVTDADCANHDCIRQGAISQAGQQIICLPHKLWVEISTSPEGTGATLNTEATPSTKTDVVSG